MKNAVLLVIAGALVFGAYYMWTHRSQSSGTVAVMTASPTPTPADLGTVARATPQQQQQPQAAATPVAQRRLAPDGIYYLVQRVSITTDSGITGDPPGTKVTLVKAGPPMQVTDGQNVFEVSPNQVTNDLDVATQVLQADSAAQAAIRAQEQAIIDKNAAQAREEAERHAPPGTLFVPHPAPPPPAPANTSPNPLDQPAYNKTTDNLHTDAFGRKYWIDVFGRPHYVN